MEPPPPYNTQPSIDITHDAAARVVQ